MSDSHTDTNAEDTLINDRTPVADRVLSDDELDDLEAPEASLASVT
jgi:hypothetical protein